MARPRFELTILADEDPDRARRKLLAAFRIAGYEYKDAAAILGVSQRQLRILVGRLGIAPEILRRRVKAGSDRRGRPPLSAPLPQALRAVFAREGTVKATAEAYGVSPPTATRWLRECGVL